jgi:two-component system osmolarity sensor histidine kinase EnvZ
MNWFADSLRARLTWLAFGMAVLSAVLTVALALGARARVLDPQVAGEAAAQYVRLQAALVQKAPLERALVLERYGGGGSGHLAGVERWRLVPAAEATPPTDDQSLPVYRNLADQIRALLPGAVEVHVGGLPQPKVWISMALDATSYWAVVPLGQVTHDLPLQLTASLFAGALVIAGIAAWTASRIARPLTVLEAAVVAVGYGARSETLRLPVSGPREVQELARRFGEVLAARDAAESSRRVMLAGLPHDLRAPLTRLRARLELVGDEKIRGGLRRDAEDIHGVMERFIAFLRGSDPAGYRFEAIDLTALVQKHMEPWISAGTDLHVSIPGHPVALSADPGMIARLLDALIDNAARYGAPPVEIVLVDGTSLVELRVSDHGPGIEPALQARALEPFTRLDEARSGPGTGLGLALAASIAKMHGGRLELSAAQGGGLAVRVLLSRSPGNGAQSGSALQ